MSVRRNGTTVDTDDEEPIWTCPIHGVVVGWWDCPLCGSEPPWGCPDDACERHHRDDDGEDRETWEDGP